MKRYFFTNQNDEIRLIKFLLQSGQCSNAAIRKAMRNRDIKINGTRIKEDVMLHQNDKIEIFLPPEGQNIKQEQSSLIELPPVVFEDDNILVINKPQGIAVHAGDEDNGEPTLTSILQAKKTASSFGLQLCHRIDRNTGGLVLLAKNRTALEEILAAIEQHNIKKFYRCIVCGIPTPSEAKLINYLAKNSHLSQVFVHAQREKGDLTAITTYRTLKTSGELALLEVSLETGRMHQIRAQLSHAGTPILGDGKYGNTVMNRKYRVKMQQLFAFRLEFSFPKNSKLEYISGTSIEIPTIDENSLLQYTKASKPGE